MIRHEGLTLSWPETVIDIAVILLLALWTARQGIGGTSRTSTRRDWDQRSFRQAADPTP